jgi:hypothetical protein
MRSLRRQALALLCLALLSLCVLFVAACGGQVPPGAGPGAAPDSSPAATAIPYPY